MISAIRNVLFFVGVLAPTVLAIVLAVVLAQPDPPKRVFVLHSYAPGYSWTDKVDQGITDVLEHWENVITQKHYMDLRSSNDPEFHKMQAQVASAEIDAFAPDVLLIHNNQAQAVGRFYAGRPAIQVVFASVNGSAEKFYAGANNVTGLVMTRPVEGIRNVLPQLSNPAVPPGRAPRLAYLIDASQPVLADRAFVDGYAWGPTVQYLGSMSVPTWPEWQRAVRVLGEQADYILVSNYRQLARHPHRPDDLVPAEEVMAWTEENSRVPIIGMQGFNVEDGGGLAVGLSPYEQGELSARVVEKLLAGTRASEIPVQANGSFLVSIRQSVLRKRGIVVPDVYTSLAKATGMYYE